MKIGGKNLVLLKKFLLTLKNGLDSPKKQNDNTKGITIAQKIRVRNINFALYHITAEPPWWREKLREEKSGTSETDPIPESKSCPCGTIEIFPQSELLSHLRKNSTSLSDSSVGSKLNPVAGVFSCNKLYTHKYSSRNRRIDKKRKENPANKQDKNQCVQNH
jgi:hypothetical protein